jgi:predicted TIM-barrel fold metal-dependent hydrolase
VAADLAGDRPHGGVVAIDAHAHVFTRGLALAAERRYAPDYDAPIDAYLSMLDRNGMSHGVLVQPSFLGIHNAYLGAALRAVPGRLRGIAVVDPARPDDLPALQAAGVVGIRLNLIGRPHPDFSDPAFRRHLTDVAALGWQVEVQAEARRLPAVLDGLLPFGVNIVVDHFGRPDPRLSLNDPGFRHLLSVAGTGRIWVKLSAAYRVFTGPDSARVAAEAAGQLRGAFGRHRLLWGSDWPHTQFEAKADPQGARRALDMWVPDHNDRRIVLADSPARLFGFAAPLPAHLDQGQAS